MSDATTLYVTSKYQRLNAVIVSGYVLLSLITTSLFITSHNANAAPSGSDLLTACTRSMQDGFESMTGKLCTWYVTPCDCNIDKTIPMVCLPESVTTETLAGLVISGLEQRPELQLLDATRAAAVILSGKYPCPASR